MLLSVTVNSKINSTASQKDGVAMQAMENTRMIWSGHLSRYTADTTPRMVASTTAITRPKNVSCRVIGSAWAILSPTDASFAP